MKTEDLHRHVCSITGKGMSEGWYIDGEYFSTQKLADKKAQSLRKTPIDEIHFYKDFKDLYSDCEEHGETDFCYWTEWYDFQDLENEGEGYDDDGILYEFEPLNKVWRRAFDLEDYEIVGGDGVTNELWEHKNTKKLVEIPIEIVRDYANIIYKD